MARGFKHGFDLRPGPFLKAAANRLDFRSRKGFPVTVAWTIAGLSFLGFLSIVAEIIEPAVLGLDIVAAKAAVALAGPVLTRVMWVFTLMGDVRVMVVETLVAALLLAVWGHPRRAGSVAILVATGSALAEVLKSIIDRPRPQVLVELLHKPLSASFPSGHAMAGILLFGTLALMLAASRLPRPVRVWGSIGTALVGVTIGLSRVYLGVHFMSDVLGAWLLGVTMLATWAAAVLIWGRTQPPPEERVVRPWGRSWWRWALVAVGVAAVVIALLVETGVMPLAMHLPKG
jgi:membrane-associated phospholipid phosphatase